MLTALSFLPARMQTGFVEVTKQPICQGGVVALSSGLCRRYNRAFISVELSPPMYNLARQLLFKLSPETSHDLSLDLIGAGGRLGINGLLTKAPARLPVTVMGLSFDNPVGLAAGLDKNGAAIDGFAQLGFGFVEIGTVTPRPQPGNPKPRLFRLPEAQAIINRMGFNNLGVDHLLARVQAAKYRGVLGINIGKNFDTPVERAVDDYLICLDKVYSHASYVTVNVSSPNTPGLRTLQFGDSLKQLLEALAERREQLVTQHGKRVPLAIKIAPDMSDEETALVAATLLESGMDAVIATNTTLSREGVEGLPHADEAGGLSGAPVLAKSTHTVKILAGELAGKMPIIAAGGITEGRHAAEKIAAGASLVQIYSGFIYKGPALIREAVDAIAALPGR
ncbi:dihydroorotate dehydrogenase [Pseudomonas sp. HLS-6 TE3448]|jgi:dihydroorotate dehydrogenase